MVALTEDRNTKMQDAELVAQPVAANAVCHAGGLAVLNATGFAAPGTTALNLLSFGRFEQAVDNTGGADGDQEILIRRGKAFYWQNHGADLVAQANVRQNCFIVDDQTVAATNGAGTRSIAGVVVAVDANGVWVEAP